jgi:hypothetical protein
MSDSDSFDSDGGAAENVSRIVPKDDDVLLGRGTKHNRHPGNLRYNGTKTSRASCKSCARVFPALQRSLLLYIYIAMLESNVNRYNSTKHVGVKKDIIKAILANVGRF